MTKLNLTNKLYRTQMILENYFESIIFSDHFPGLKGCLEDVSEKVLRSRPDSNDWSENKAQTIFQILQQLFEDENGPNFNNFYSKCIHPMSSTYINNLSEKKTYEDQLRNCLPLGMFSHKISIITIFDLKHLTFNRKTYLIVTYHIKNFLVEFYMAIA